jgi:hypothetical protein
MLNSHSLHLVSELFDLEKAIFIKQTPNYRTFSSFHEIALEENPYILTEIIGYRKNKRNILPG